jgi:hypothetical protein
MFKEVKIQVWCESEEVWVLTLKEIKEIMEMLRTIQRRAEIISIESGKNDMY